MKQHQTHQTRNIVIAVCLTAFAVTYVLIALLRPDLYLSTITMGIIILALGFFVGMVVQILIDKEYFKDYQRQIDELNREIESQCQIIEEQNTMILGLSEQLDPYVTAANRAADRRNRNQRFRAIFQVIETIPGETGSPVSRKSRIG